MKTIHQALDETWVKIITSPGVEPTAVCLDAQSFKQLMASYETVADGSLYTTVEGHRWRDLPIRIERPPLVAVDLYTRDTIPDEPIQEPVLVAIEYRCQDTARLGVLEHPLTEGWPIQNTVRWPIDGKDPQAWLADEVAARVAGLPLVTCRADEVALEELHGAVQNIVLQSLIAALGKKTT